MGLERVSLVAQRLNLFRQFKRPIMITVAGTNGKGSSCAMLERVYAEAGYRVGCYTSPHLQRYHERVRVDGRQISDDDLCDAFAAVESARESVELTYFEMGTLAAFWHFSQQPLDVLVLEVGLGGRLDAVNIIDADCAIVTNVDMDHMEYLGDTREKIGLEKAGVYRANQIAICGDRSPPESLVLFAKSVGANLHCIQHAFDARPGEAFWQYRDAKGILEIPQLSLKGIFQRDNAASVIFAIHALSSRLPVSDKVITDTLPKVQLVGRFQYLHRHPDIILDVAHNPQAAESLFDNLMELRKNLPKQGRLIAVFSMLADKDIHAVVGVLLRIFNCWHIAQINHPRSVKLDDLARIMRGCGVTTEVQTHLSVELAMAEAYKSVTKNDKIIVFGSFFTVAAALDYWDARGFQS